MAFLKDETKLNGAAKTLNELIRDTDAQITRLATRRAELLNWQTALAGNLVDFTNADRTEYNAELVRLNNRINAEL